MKATFLFLPSILTPLLNSPLQSFPDIQDMKRGKDERERKGRLLTEGSHIVSTPDTPSPPRSSTGTPVLSTGFFLFFNFYILFRLRWVFVAASGLFPAVLLRLFTAVASLVAEHGL